MGNDIKFEFDYDAYDAPIELTSVKALVNEVMTTSSAMTNILAWIILGIKVLSVVGLMIYWKLMRDKEYLKALQKWQNTTHQNSVDDVNINEVRKELSKMI